LALVVQEALQVEVDRMAPIVFSRPFLALEVEVRVVVVMGMPAVLEVEQDLMEKMAV
jgi:hypothetical protein